MARAKRFHFDVTHQPAQVRQAVLQKIDEEKQAGRQPVVLFDLDGTLFDNGPRTTHILREFAQHTQRASLVSALERAQGTMLPYALKDILAELHDVDDVLLKEAGAFWKDRFFIDGYIKHDRPLPGATAFVRALWDAGATVVYLSGRDSPNMLLGTSESLRTHGFPIGLPRTVLTLKDAFETEDLHFKREAAAFLNTLGQVVASFDNEPANLNLFAQMWPRADHVALATSHAPNPAPLSPAIKVIEDFRA